MSMKRAKDSTSGAYMIINKVNGKAYIGISKNVKYRLKNHKWLLKERVHFNKRLQNSYNKHGEQAFSFQVLEYCPIDELSEKEKHYINFFNTVEKGYNLKTGGHENLVFSEETKRKISKSNKGRVISQKTREKIRKTLTGFKHSEEARRNMGESHKGPGNGNYRKGHLFSEERRINMSLAQKGKKQTEEHIKNMIEARHGKYFSIDEKIKMHELNKKNKLTRIQIAEMYNLNRQTVGKYIQEAESHLKKHKGVG
jgi:group I intron endonuclease